MPPSPPSPLARLRKIALSFPGAHEVEAWGAPTFRVNNKLFAMYAHANNHHGAGHHSVWVKSTPINQSLMIGANPKRFFSPPYVGAGGWIGVKLDGRVNWKELGDILRDGYELIAAKKKRAATRRAVRPAASAAKRATEARRTGSSDRTRIDPRQRS